MMMVLRMLLDDVVAIVMNELDLHFPLCLSYVGSGHYDVGPLDHGWYQVPLDSCCYC
jgi:hypothetical protein